MSLFSAPESVLIKTTLLKSLQRCCSQHPDLALVKTSTDNSPGRQHYAQMIEFPGAYSYTSGKAYDNLVLQATLPGVKKLLLWLALFWENVLPLQLDLIQG